MLHKNGISFIEDQIKKGCRCKHIALMSGDLNGKTESRANILGVKIFKKPFNFEELTNWLDEIENNIDPERELSDWLLNSSK